MKTPKIVIVGGGLAGLTAAIHLAKTGYKITVFEKESYPHHKVCGEYLSAEVLPYLEFLKIPLEALNPVRINRLQFSTVNGRSLDTELPMGGLGVSRYALDNLFYQTALNNGVEVLQEKVLQVSYEENGFKINTTVNNCSADVVLGAYGKRSGLDRELERPFFKASAPWVAVKSHYKNDNFPNDLVALHNFDGGYCGLSKTESGAVNCCYLSTYKSFKAAKDLDTHQKEVLQKNPFLKQFFEDSEPLFKKPFTIAQISFSRKNAVQDHVVMLGDAAGLIHPLCGNGMAMAIHSAKLASESIVIAYGAGVLNREVLEQQYTQKWNREFNNRLTAGKWLQKVLLNDSLAEMSQKLISKMPFLLPAIIKQTHGNFVV